MLYGLFLFFHVPYIASNSIAWTGAVIAAYVLNRKWVFRSNRRIPEEFFSFAALRFITLLVENVLLWLAVDQLSLSLIGSKLIVEQQRRKTLRESVCLTERPIFCSEHRRR